MKVSYLRHNQLFFRNSGYSELGSFISPILQEKTFLWVPNFAYFIDGQKITLDKKTVL